MPAIGISGRVRRSARFLRPFAREKTVVLTALNFLYQIAKRFVTEHAASCRLDFCVSRSKFFQRAFVSRPIPNSQSEQSVKFSGRRRVRQESLQSENSVRIVQDLVKCAFAG